jgi:hypothetical protein
MGSNTSLASSSQPDARGERNLNYLANNAWLAGAANSAFYLIGSAVLQCMECHRTTKVRQKTFYFSRFQSVRRVNTADSANTVNMNAPTLVGVHNAQISA